MVRSNECAPKSVLILKKNKINEKAFGKKPRPKITSSQQKIINANDNAYYCRVVKHLDTARSNECAPKGVPILKIFSMKKPSSKNPAPKIISSQRSSHNTNEKSYYFRVIKY